MVKFRSLFDNGLRRAGYLSSVGETKVPDTLKLVSPGSENEDFNTQNALTGEALASRPADRGLKITCQAKPRVSL